MELKDIPAHEIDWTTEPIFGRVLTLTNKTLHDSYRNPIQEDAKYWVGKHKPTGMIIIINVDQKILQDKMNSKLMEEGRLN